MPSPFRWTAAGFTLVFVLALRSALEDPPFKLATPAPAIKLHPARLDKFEGQNCGECHADVVAEWADTAHAISWQDEFYREALKDKSHPQSCFACHTPKPLFAAGLAVRAETRSEFQDLGVACASCHLGPEGVMLGPLGQSTSAHKSQASDSLTTKASSALCSVCHATNVGPVVGIAKDFESSHRAERGQSCIGCHMQALERKPAKGANDGTRAYAGRSHAIQTPRDPTFLAQAFEVSLRVDGKRSIVTIQNRAGHRVPGLIGREMHFKAELFDAQGKLAAKGEQSFDARSYLPVEKSAELILNAVGAKVHLLGTHADPRAEEPVTFLDRELVPGG